MPTFEKLITDDSFLCDYVVYKGNDSGLIIYDSGASDDYTTPAQIRNALPAEYAGRIAKIKSFSRNEVVLITKENVSFEAELPSFNGKTVYELPITRLASNIPVVKIKVNGIEQEVIFDTGAPCFFSIDRNVLSRPTGNRKNEWLPLDGQYADVNLYSAECSHACGFEFHTERVASLVEHPNYVNVLLKRLGCRGILGMEKFDEFDVCLNKDISIMFIKR